MILTAEFTAQLALAPLKMTAVAAVKFAPLTTTLAPGLPLAGEKLMIRGPATKLAALVAVPPGVVTLIGPLVAVADTVAVIAAPESTWHAAATPLNRTDVAPVKPVPEIATRAPDSAPAGVKPPIAGLTRKVPALVPVPAAVVTAGCRGRAGRMAGAVSG